jgi:hypothetical protein
MVGGDFSGSGRTIYDPLSTRPDPDNPGGFIRDPFPGNVIPRDRLSPVGVNIASYLAEGGQGDVNASANVVDAADQFSFNLTHEITRRMSVSGTYMYYDSEEPSPLFIGGPYDPGNFLFFRRVHLVAANATHIPSDDSVVTLRYGYFSFDNAFTVPEFDVASLGFSQNFVSQVSQQIFPGIGFDEYPFGGAGGADETRHYSHSANGTWSKFVGSHTLKIGGDYRRIGSDMYTFDDPAGSFDFDRRFTLGPNPDVPDPGSGDGLADLLLGYPSFGAIGTASSQQRYIDYFSAFVHDDWRVSKQIGSCIRPVDSSS